MFTDTDSSQDASATDTVKLTIKLTNESDVVLNSVTIKDELFSFNETIASIGKTANASKNKTLTLTSTHIDGGVLDTWIVVDATEFSKPLYIHFVRDLEDYPLE